MLEFIVISSIIIIIIIISNSNICINAVGLDEVCKISKMKGTNYFRLLNAIVSCCILWFAEGPGYVFQHIISTHHCVTVCDFVTFC